MVYSRANTVPGSNLAVSTDVVSCCEGEQSFRRLAISCDIPPPPPSENSLSSKIFCAISESTVNILGLHFIILGLAFIPPLHEGILHIWHCIFIVLLVFIISKLSECSRHEPYSEDLIY